MKKIRIIILTVSVASVLILVCVGSWILKERGKMLDLTVRFLKDEKPLTNSLVAVSTTTAYYHWWYEGFFSGDYSLKIEKMGAQTTYATTDQYGRIHISGNAVFLSVKIAVGARFIKIYSENINVLTAIPSQFEVHVSDPEGFRPVCTRPVDRKTEQIPKISTQPTTGNNVTVYARSLESIHAVTTYQKSDYYELIRRAELLDAYREKLKDSFDVIYVELESTIGDKSVFSRMPYRVKYSDSQEIYVQWYSQNDSSNPESNSFIWIYVPKNQTYDLELCPHATNWSGLAEDKQAEKKGFSLKKRIVRHIVPQREPMRPILTVNFDDEIRELKAADRRRLREERIHAFREQQTFSAKVNRIIRFLIDHWASMMLVVIPFLLAFIVGRGQFLRERSGR